MILLKEGNQQAGAEGKPVQAMGQGRVKELIGERQAFSTSGSPCERLYWPALTLPALSDSSSQLEALSVQRDDPRSPVP